MSQFWLLGLGAQLTMPWISSFSRDPLHRQLYLALRRAILAGELERGCRLPASRALAEEQGVSRNVVLAAYEQLQAEGYLEARRGAGTFVAPQLPEELLRASPGRAAPLETPASPPRLSGYARRALDEGIGEPEDGPVPVCDFRYGVPATDPQTHEVWRRCVARQSRRPDLGYAPPAGHAGLRQSLAGYLRRCRGVDCEASQILITTGSQQALDLATRALLDPGDVVAIEDPCYLGARRVLAALGCVLRPARVDGSGLDPESIDPRARLVYVTPSHQFPSGAVMPAERRLALLDWAAQNEGWVLEDDYDSEFRYRGRPLAALQGLDRQSRTIYVGTFSKVLYPALRLGFLVVPKQLVPAFAAVKWLADRHTPTLLQAALAELLDAGHYERHLRRARIQSAACLRALLEALEEHFGDRIEIEGCEAGIHLVLWLRDLTPEQLPERIDRARQQGLGIYPIGPYYWQPPARAGLLIGWAALDPVALRDGVARLAKVLS